MGSLGKLGMTDNKIVILSRGKWYNVFVTIANDKN